MNTTDQDIDPSKISVSEHSPIISMLMSVIDSQKSQLKEQSDQLSRLSEQIRTFCWKTKKSILEKLNHDNLTGVDESIKILGKWIYFKNYVQNTITRISNTNKSGVF